MSKKWLIQVGAVIGVIFMVYYVSSGSKAPPKQIPLAEPAKIQFEKYIGASGITEPNSENIEVGTNKPGIVKEINFTVGQQVVQGDILFVIENSEAVAAMNQAKAELNNAQQQYNVVAGLEDERAVSKDERNSRRNNLAMAKAKFEQAQAALELHNVRSPIDGTVLSKNIRVGEYAPSGIISDPLVMVGNLNPMNIRVDIDENDAWRFDASAKAIAFVRGNNDIKADLQFVRIEPYVRPKKSLTGDSVERVDTRVLQVIYQFDPTNLNVYTGQQMDVYIEDAKK